MRKNAGIVVAAILTMAAATGFVVYLTPLIRPQNLGKHQPARLLNGFYSYSTPEDVQAQIRSAGRDWEVVKTGNPETAVDHLYIAKVRGYSDSGMKGDLWFYFFRNRLMRIHFSPRNVQDYWMRLTQRENVQATPAKIASVFEAHPNANVEIWLNMREPGEHYIGWRDHRLQREVDHAYD